MTSVEVMIVAPGWPRVRWRWAAPRWLWASIPTSSSALAVDEAVASWQELFGEPLPDDTVIKVSRITRRCRRCGGLGTVARATVGMKEACECRKHRAVARERSWRGTTTTRSEFHRILPGERGWVPPPAAPQQPSD